MGTGIVYLFTVVLIPFFDKIWSHFTKERVFTRDFDFHPNSIGKYLAIGVVGGLCYHFEVSVIHAAYILFLAIGVLWGMNPRISYLWALILILYIPVYLLIDQQTKAEILSIYMYYFLVIGIIFHVTHVLSNKNKTVWK